MFTREPVISEPEHFPLSSYCSSSISIIPSLKPSGEFPQSGVALNLSSVLIQTLHFCLCLRKWSHVQISCPFLPCCAISDISCVFSVSLDVLWKHCGSVCGYILQCLFFLFSLDILRPKWQELLNSKSYFPRFFSVAVIKHFNKKWLSRRFIPERGQSRNSR